MRANVTGFGKAVVLALGLGGFVAAAGPANAADECKTYVKANFAKAACDYNTHQTMMHKMAMNKKMATHKMVAAKKPAHTMAKKKVVHKKKKTA